MKKYIGFIFFIFINQSCFLAYGVEKSCNVILLGAGDSLISFYEDTLRRGFLNIEDLITARDLLENEEQLQNPFLNRSNQSNSATELIRSTNFITAVNQGYSRELLLAWINSKILELEKSNEDKDRASQQTDALYIKAVFHRIEAGTFEHFENNHKLVSTKTPGTYVYAGGDSKLISTTIPGAFEMQATHVTQGQWLEIMESNPSSNQEDFAAETMDFPVENITIWTAMVYANRLSVREGYDPVYNLEGIKFKGSLTTGDYAPDQDILSVGINAPGGDIYKAHGYRLPTIEEYYIVAFDRGRFGSQHALQDYFIKSGLNISDFANYKGNGDSKTTHVKAMRPFSSNGHNFYDLFGNVHSFTSSMYANERWLSLNNRAHNYNSGALAHSLAGAGYDSNIENVWEIANNKYLLINQTSESTGIRLVRSLEK